MDRKNRRLFVGCDNKMMAVVDADTGKVLATPPIGDGVDATRFDRETGLAFASCGEGVADRGAGGFAGQIQRRGKCSHRAGRAHDGAGFEDAQCVSGDGEVRPAPGGHG